MSKKSVLFALLVLAIAGCAATVYAANYCYIGQASGWLSSSGDYEIVKLTLRGGVRYWISVTVPWSADFDLLLLDGNGNHLASSNRGSYGDTENIYYTPSRSGTYYLAVYSFKSSGSYTAKLSKRC